MTDFLYTVLWVVVYSFPVFLIQLLLCFKIKNKLFRFFPVYLLAVGWIFTVDMFFNFSGIHSGWHELGAFFVGVYVAIFSLGVTVAFVVHKLYIKHKNKKR